MDRRPNFFRAPGPSPPGLAGAMEHRDMLFDGLAFGSGFDVPLDDAAWYRQCHESVAAREAASTLDDGGVLSSVLALGRGLDEDDDESGPYQGQVGPPRAAGSSTARAVHRAAVVAAPSLASAPALQTLEAVGAPALHQPVLSAPPAVVTPAAGNRFRIAKGPETSGNNREARRGSSNAGARASVACTVPAVPDHYRVAASVSAAPRAAVTVAAPDPQPPEPPRATTVAPAARVAAAHAAAPAPAAESSPAMFGIAPANLVASASAVVRRLHASHGAVFEQAGTGEPVAIDGRAYLLFRNLGDADTARRACAVPLRVGGADLCIVPLRPSAALAIISHSGPVPSDLSAAEVCEAVADAEGISLTPHNCPGLFIAPDFRSATVLSAPDWRIRLRTGLVELGFSSAEWEIAHEATSPEPHCGTSLVVDSGGERPDHGVMRIDATQPDFRPAAAEQRDIPRVPQIIHSERGSSAMHRPATTPAALRVPELQASPAFSQGSPAGMVRTSATSSAPKSTRAVVAEPRKLAVKYCFAITGLPAAISLAASLVRLASVHPLLSLALVTRGSQRTLFGSLSSSHTRGVLGKMMTEAAHRLCLGHSFAFELHVATDIISWPPPVNGSVYMFADPQRLGSPPELLGADPVRLEATRLPSSTTVADLRSILSLTGVAPSIELRLPEGCHVNVTAYLTFSSPADAKAAMSLRLRFMIHGELLKLRRIPAVIDPELWLPQSVAQNALISSATATAPVEGDDCDEALELLKRLSAGGGLPEDGEALDVADTDAGTAEVVAAAGASVLSADSAPGSLRAELLCNTATSADQPPKSAVRYCFAITGLPAAVSLAASLARLTSMHPLLSLALGTRRSQRTLYGTLSSARGGLRKMLKATAYQLCSGSGHSSSWNIELHVATDIVVWPPIVKGSVYTFADPRRLGSPPEVLGADPVRLEANGLPSSTTVADLRSVLSLTGGVASVALEPTLGYLNKVTAYLTFSSPADAEAALGLRHRFMIHGEFLKLRQIPAVIDPALWLPRSQAQPDSESEAAVPVPVQGATGTGSAPLSSLAAAATAPVEVDDCGEALEVLES